MACRSCHHQGLKPHSFHGSARLKPCPDTNQIITSCSRKCRNSSRRLSAGAWSFYISARISGRFPRASTRPRLMPCIRAWLQPCRWRQSIQGFSPRCLPPCHVRETIGELLGPLHQSRLHRVRRYVFPMLDEALPTLHARLGEATLPDLSPMAAFLLQAV